MSVTGIGEIATAADDLVKLLAGILQDREPIRHARIMNRLVVILALKCEKTGITPATEVAITCAELTPAVQQQITTAVTAEIKAAQPAIIHSLNKTTMNTAPTLTDITTKLATLTNQVAQKLGGTKVNAFRNAVIAGIKSVPLTNTATVGNICGYVILIIQKIAAITANRAFIQLSVIAQYIWNDIETGRTGLIAVIQQFIAAEKQIAQLKAVGAEETKAPDPNLNADELSLAQLFGALTVEVILFFGKAQAAQYVEAYVNGVNYIYTQTITDKLLVDTSFGVAIDIAVLLQKPSLQTGLTVAENIYDDFAGGSVTIFNIEGRISTELAAIKEAA